MGKKRVVKLPKSVKIKCPNCLQGFRLDVPEKDTFQTIDCPKCQQKITTPMTQCCIVCAYSDKKCPSSLLIEARYKGLEIR